MPGTQRKAVINSQTSGRFQTKTIGGRDHIITQMVPIVGDTVMNSIYYPDEEVTASFEQLNNLPAPNGHPMIEGQSVSAFHPMAVNAFNIGGFIKAPTKKGKRVINELWVDVEIANTTDDGKEVVRRIKAGEKVGVSTGLGLTLTTQNGTGEDGHEYTAIGKGYKFDHVALLLNEVAAGAHAGTELVTNDGDKLVVGIVENATVSDFMSSIETALQKQFASGDNNVWLRDFIIDESAAVYSVYDDEKGQSVMYKIGIRKVDDNVITEGMPMPVEEKTSFIPISNEGQPPQPEEDEMEITRENATEFLVNLGLTVTDPKSAVAVANAEALASFDTHKDAFTAWQAEQAETLNAKRTECIEATGLKAEQVENMTIETMDTLITNASKGVNNSLRSGGGVEPTEEQKTEAKGTASTFVRGVTAE